MAATKGDAPQVCFAPSSRIGEYRACNGSGQRHLKFTYRPRYTPERRMLMRIGRASIVSRDHVALNSTLCAGYQSVDWTVKLRVQAVFEAIFGRLGHAAHARQQRCASRRKLGGLRTPHPWRGLRTLVGPGGACRQAREEAEVGRCAGLPPCVHVHGSAESLWRACTFFGSAGTNARPGTCAKAAS